ncbi:aspartate--tRNA ligase [bacterium]|nr:aspartate--tRNA ligase [bacterium]
MKRFFCLDVPQFEGKEVELFGWIHNRRDHGKLVFLDLRDASGIVQLVVLPDSSAYKTAKKLGPEFVVRVKGKVNRRPKGMENPKLPTGEVEVEVKELEILSKAKPPVFELDKDTRKVKEEVRLKYRYLDLRTERMKENLRKKEELVSAFRAFLKKHRFFELETPYITKGTPEGAREFIVPSRLHPGKFYVLPQSPQQFKQLLMVAGFERYFQFARCFRDEDPRGDRQPEFTQLDLEMSFVREEDILNLVEEMMIEAVKKVYPHKKILEIPFPRLTFEEAINKFGTDTPDLRPNKESNKELAFCWIVDMPLFEWSETEKKMVSVHHPFTAPKEGDEEKLASTPSEVKAQAYDLVLNGVELGGGSIRIHRPELQRKVFEILGLSDEEIEEKFGHLLKAFEFGVPPHGGIALGLDRIVMVLQGEKSIREVIPFPKTGDGRDLLMGAPSELPEEQLKEVHIEVRKKKAS